jgi:hypothetical protein
MSNPTLPLSLELIPGGLWTAFAVLVLCVFWFGLLRPRRGRCVNAPPLVLHAKNGIPFIGVLIEFFSSPNTMVQRCVKDYGPIFTIPVRLTIQCVDSILERSILRSCYLPFPLNRYFTSA